MRITCPSCSHQFEVDPVMVSGRTFKVRCSKCKLRSEVDQRTGEVLGPVDGVSTGDTAEVGGRRAPPPDPRSSVVRNPPTRSAPTERSARPPTPSPGPRIEPRKTSSPVAPAPGAEAIAALREQLDATHRDMMSFDALRIFGVGMDVASSDLMRIYGELRDYWRPGKWTGHLAEAEMGKVRAIADRLDQAYNEVSDVERRRRARGATPMPGTAMPAGRMSDPGSDRLAGPDGEAPSEDEMFFARGKEAFNAKRFGEAKEAFEQCVALKPDEARYSLKLGEAVLRLTSLDGEPDFETASGHLDHALELEPENIDALVAYGHLLKAQGEVKRAMRYFKQVRDLDRKHHEANREIRLYLARKRKGAESGTATAKLKKLLTKKL